MNISVGLHQDVARQGETTFLAVPAIILPTTNVSRQACSAIAIWRWKKLAT